jgi:tellurite resistance protein
MALHRYLRNIRPDEEMLIDAVDALLGLNPEETVRFLAAGKAVIDADGILHPEEVAMLNELAVQLTGVALA